SVPDPAPSLVPPDPTDFEEIEPDPAGYGIPDSAERFADDEGYLLPRPMARGEAAGVVPEGLEEFYSQDLEWETCTDFGGPQGAEGGPECGWAHGCASLECSDPEGQTIAFAVSLLQATGGDSAGTVLVNPGARGSIGIDLPREQIFADLNEDFTNAGF